MKADDGAGKAAEQITKQIDYLARALKAPRIRQAATRLGDQARDAGWSHEEYLAAVLGRQVASRTANGTKMRISAAHFPQRTSTVERVPSASSIGGSSSSTRAR